MFLINKWIDGFCCKCMYTTVCLGTNSADLDQMPRSVASVMVLYRLPKSRVWDPSITKTRLFKYIENFTSKI